MKRGIAEVILEMGLEHAVGGVVKHYAPILHQCLFGSKSQVERGRRCFRPDAIRHALNG